MYCKKCGSLIEDDAPCCKYCGQKYKFWSGNSTVKYVSIFLVFLTWLGTNFYFLASSPKVRDPHGSFVPFIHNYKGSSTWSFVVDIRYYDASEFLFYTFVIPIIVFLIYRFIHSIRVNSKANYIIKMRKYNH